MPSWPVPCWVTTAEEAERWRPGAEREPGWIGIGATHALSAPPPRRVVVRRADGTSAEGVITAFRFTERGAEAEVRPLAVRAEAHSCPECGSCREGDARCEVCRPAETTRGPAGMTSDVGFIRLRAAEGAAMLADALRREVMVWEQLGALTAPGDAESAAAPESIRPRNVYRVDQVVVRVGGRPLVTINGEGYRAALTALAAWVQSLARWQPSAPPLPAWRALLAREPLWDRAVRWWRDRSARRSQAAQDRHAAAVTRALVGGRLGVGVSGLPVDEPPLESPARRTARTGPGPAPRR